MSPAGLWWRVGLLASTGFLVYANSFSGPFVVDDVATIVENRQIREWWRLSSLLFPERELPVAGRPLVNASFALNYALGGLDVWGYHLLNIAVHVGCALVLFGIVRRTLQRPGFSTPFDSAPLNLALAVSLLWVVHPLNTEVVDYLTQRTESMMGLFFLLTLYASIRAAAAPRQRGWSVIAVLSCALGMGCKETMVVAPIMVLLYDRAYLFDSVAAAVKARWHLYAGLAATWVVLLLLLWSGPRAHSAGWSSGVSVWTYLLNQPSMIGRYLRLAFWPRALVVNYGWPMPLTLGEVWPQALAVAALLVAALVSWIKYPWLGFLGTWFFITLSPTSSVVPIATEVGAERRMYLPLIALIVLAVIAGSSLVDAIGRLRLTQRSPRHA